MRYLGTHVSTAGGVAMAPLRGKEVGVNTIQLFAKNNNQWLARKPLSQGEIETFHQNKKECGIAIAFSHAGYLINLASPDQKNHALSMRSLEQELERADQLDLDFVVLHPGAHVGSGTETAIQKIAESINSVFEHFPNLKTVLLLENTAGQGSSVGSQFEELATILSKIERQQNIGVCFDTCHGFAAGYAMNTEEGYQRMWKEFDQTIGLKRLKAMHLNDSKRELGSRVDRHEHIGKGKIGDDGFRFLMCDKRFEKIPMALETPKHDNPKKYDPVNIKRLMSFVSEK